MFTKLKREVEQLRRDMDCLYNGMHKMRDLFAKDRNGTARPKVDILTDQVEAFRVNTVNTVNKLTEEIRNKK